MTKDIKNDKTRQNKKSKLLRFERLPSGEKVLKLSDKRHGERVVEKYTLDEIKQAFAEA